MLIINDCRRVIRWDCEEGLHDGLTYDVSTSKIGRSTISIHGTQEAGLSPGDNLAFVGLFKTLVFG